MKKIVSLVMIMAMATPVANAKPVNTYADGALVPLAQQKVCWALKREANKQGLVGKTLNNKRYAYHHQCGWMIVTGKYLKRWNGRYDSKQYGHVFSSKKAKHDFYKALHIKKKTKKKRSTNSDTVAKAFFSKEAKKNREEMKRVRLLNYTKFIKRTNTK